MKIWNNLKKIFSPLARFIDKRIITPITKLVIKFQEVFKGNSNTFEKLLNKKQTLIVVSLFFALAFFFIIERSSNAMIYQTAEILYSQPVIAEYNQEAYVVEGLPEVADITLIGRSSDIYLAKQYPDHEISVDLRDLKPGSHKVSLKYKQRLNSLDYKLDPSTATIVVYEKVSETRSLSHDVLHQDKLLSKLIISDIELERADIIIKGAEHTLANVANVKALIDINNISNPQIGTMNLNEVPIVAYDANGEIVEVEIVPKTVKATIKIESPSKEVPIRIVPKGDLAFGKAISTLTSNVPNVVIYGEPSVLETIDYLPAEIDITNVANDRDYNVNLKNPSGVRDISVKTITVKLTIGEAATQEFEDITVSFDNLGSNFTVFSASEKDNKVTVVVNGTKELLENLERSTIIAKVNLNGLGVGTHDINVDVSGSDVRLQYKPKVRTVQVVIRAK